MPEPSTEVTETRSSLVKVEIGGKTYDAAQIKQCHTCMHPARKEIEQRVLSGHSYRDIAQHYSGTEYSVGGEPRAFPELEWMSIYTHFKRGHMPVEAAALRQIMDNRAEELGEHYEAETALLVDGYSFSRQVLQKTQEGLLAGDIKPSVSDGINAARLLREMDTDAGGNVDTEVWSQAMTRYFEVAQKIMPQDMWDRFAQALAVDPILLAIQKRLEAVADEPLDAEIVDDEGAKA
jgi:hypothetical protein